MDINENIVFIAAIFFALALLALPSLGLVAGPTFAALGAALFLSLAAVMIIAKSPLQIRRSDWILWLLMIGFGLWSSLAICSSCNHAVAIEHSIQASLIFSGGLLLLELGRRVPLDSFITGRQILRLVTIGLVIGVTILLLDRGFGFPLRKFFGMDNHPTQYNRGIAYVSIMILPLIAYGTRTKNYFLVLILVVAINLALGFGSNTTAVVTWVFAVVAAVLAYYFPRLIKIALQTMVTGIFLTAPWLVEAISSLHSRFAGVIKGSATHRLEIWNYMAARIDDHPWLGWGLGTARELPVTEAERLQYIYAGIEGIYPHNQLLQLWVETGVVGVLLFLIFIHLVIGRIARSESWVRPFAYAALVMALATAMVNYEITTDSWWDCLAITSLLFIILQRPGLKE